MGQQSLLRDPHETMGRMVAAGEERTRPVNAADGWVVLLTAREQWVEMMAGRLRNEGLRVVTRHRPHGLGSHLGAFWRMELLVPELAVPRAKQILAETSAQPFRGVPDDPAGPWRPEVIDAREEAKRSRPPYPDPIPKCSSWIPRTCCIA